MADFEPFKIYTLLYIIFYPKQSVYLPAFMRVQLIEKFTETSRSPPEQIIRSDTVDLRAFPFRNFKKMFLS